MRELSVIVVFYRSGKSLRRCLESIAASGSRRSLEVVVVDNGPGDDGARIVDSFPGVRLIKAEQNLGYAGGVNQGLAATSGQYLMIVNPDVEIHPGALDDLADFLDAHPSTAIAAPKLLNPDGSLQPSCRRDYTLATVLLRRTFLGRLFPNAPALRRHLMLDYDHETPRAVPWVTGAAMMVRREAVKDVGGMDERYFLYFEDVDWCVRMRARGWAVHYVPDAAANHDWQRASRGWNYLAGRHLRSGLRFYQRWSGFAFLLRRHRATWLRLTLVGFDVAAVVVAVLTALFLRQQLAPLLPKPLWAFSSYVPLVFASLVAYLGSFAALGLYRDTEEGDWVDVGFRVARASTLGVLALMTAGFILDERSYSRLIILMSWPLTAIFALLARRTLAEVFYRPQRDPWSRRRVALLGDDPALDRIATLMHEEPALGWEPIRLRRASSIDFDRRNAETVMIRHLAEQRILHLVVTRLSLGLTEEELPEALLALRANGFAVRVAGASSDFSPLGGRRESLGFVSWTAFDAFSLRPGALSKRCSDFVGSLLLLAAGSLPFFVYLAIHRARRRKISEAHKQTVEHRVESPPARYQDGGGTSRKYPLLIDVLRGRLSLVGPRPLQPGDAVPGGQAWATVRSRYRPGLVGPWSVAFRLTPEAEMLQEIHYLERWSLEEDLKILARTAVLRASPLKNAPAPLANPQSSAASEPTKSTRTRTRSSEGEAKETAN